MLSYSLLPPEQLLNIADRYLGISSAIAMVSIPFVFSASIVKELYSATDNQVPDYRGVIWTTVLVFLTFWIYRVIFKGVVEMSEKVSAMMLNYYKWSGFLELLNNMLVQVGNYEITSLNVTMFLLSLSLLLAITAGEVFIFLRLFFLAALYILGPIALVISIYKPTRKIFGKWVLLTSQVLLWSILLRILQGIILAANFQQYILEGDLVVTFVISASLVISYTLIPLVSMKLLNTESVNLFYELAVNAKQIFNTKLNIEHRKFVQKTFSAAKVITNIPNVIWKKFHKEKIDKKQTMDDNQMRLR